MKFLKIFILFVKRYTRKIKKYLIILGLILLVVILEWSTINDLSNKKIVSEGIVGTYTENDLPDVVTSLLSDGLTKVNEKGIPEPSLAESWEVNPDTNLYTFKLKKDLYWIDGLEMKASEVAVLVPDVFVSALDDKTLQIKLEDSFSPFPTLLTKPILKKESFIGFGPYRIKSVEKNIIFVKKMILEPNSKDLPEVILKFYPNEIIAKQAFRMGEVQSLMGVNSSLEFSDESPFKIESRTNYSKLVAIFYNTQDKILSDKNFRLALSFATPSIDNEVKAKTSISPKSWAFNASLKDFLNNSEEGKKYLKKIKQGKEEVITLTTITSLENIGTKIVSEWNRFGINAVLRVESGIPQNFQALLISQGIPLDPDQYSLWHSTQTLTNISKYSSSNQFSPRVDKDLEDGRKTTKAEIRKVRYLDFQKVLQEDSPATFLYFPKYNVVFFKKIENDLKKVLSLQFADLQLNN